MLVSHAPAQPDQAKPDDSRRSQDALTPYVLHRLIQRRDSGVRSDATLRSTCSPNIGEKTDDD